MSIKKFLAAGIAGLAVIALAPLTLADHLEIERSHVIKAEPAALYALLNSSEEFQRYNPFIDEDPNLKITLSGPRTGVGAAFDFEAGVQTITATEPDRSVAMDINMGFMGNPQQSFLIEKVEGGTKVTWTLRSEFGLNPMGRVSGLFLDDYLGGSWERGLKNLEREALEG